MLAMNELLTYTCMASVDAWKDASLNVPETGDNHVDWDCGAIIGIGQSTKSMIGHCLGAAEGIEKDVRCIAKSSFGFGDVNGISIWKKW